MRNVGWGLMVLFAASGLLAMPAAAGESAWGPLERNFRTLPIEARRGIGPLFWLHGDESPARLQMYLQRVAESGNGTFTAESRPHRDWLGEGWFRDLGICLAEAKRLHLTMWIFDEKWWPSQGVGGMVPPRYAAKRLQAEATELAGPRSYKAEGFAGERYIAAVAGRVTAEGAIDGSSLVDLAPSIRDGRLCWAVPEGKWRVMKFTHVQAPGLGQHHGKQLSVDGASRDCVDWFLATVYQPHYERFHADFGQTIQGFFYDEPETRGDWGTELNRVLAEWGVDWKRAYVAYKFRLAGEEQAAAAYQYRDALADAWGRTMYGGIAAWCHAHGVRSMGHFMEHANLYLHPDYCAGDMMRLQRYSDLGALDAVFDQFVMGRHDARDAPCWQTPKLASSIAHACGKPDDLTMVEIFGARGQDLTYPEMKWWADHMFASGVNFLIPHSFNPRAPYDRDCPPYFYNGGYEPRYPLYRVFADYASRLHLLLAGGRHVCPAAVLFGGQSRQVGKMIPPDGISTAFQDAGYDCDWLPFDVYQRDARIDGRCVRLHAEIYHVLVLPPVEVIPYDTLAKVKQFHDAGGTVIGYGFLPSKSATLGKTPADIAALCAAIWPKAETGKNREETAANAGRAYFLPDERPTAEQVSRVLRAATRYPPPLVCGAPSVALASGGNGWLHILNRERDGQGVTLICNQQHQGPAQTFEFQFAAAGKPMLWDAMRNEIQAIPYTRAGQCKGRFALRLEPLQSAVVVFARDKEDRPTLLAADAQPKAAPIVVARTAQTVTTPTPPPPQDPKMLTLSPAKADPFTGRFQLPAAWLDGTSRVYLECGAIRPEGAAAVSLNGQYAGGFIGKPYRLNLTEKLRPGENTLDIAPFAPESVRIAVYDR